jgi:hypothetical protein
VPVRPKKARVILYPAIFVVYSTAYSEAGDVSMIASHKPSDTTVYCRTSPVRGKRAGSLLHAFSYLFAHPEPEARDWTGWSATGRISLSFYLLYSARQELQATGIGAHGAANQGHCHL